MILLFVFMAQVFALCEISYEIKRRFYQEVLSPDLKWCKSANKHRKDSGGSSIGIDLSPRKREVF